ncbi:Multidrug resistance protein MdtA [Neorhizobium galegae bv. orientalis]|nr:Multidrug resistance protein MdtA [Neorhizobium galegae bv. orientalis]
MDRAQGPSKEQKRFPVCSMERALCACVVIAGALLGDKLFVGTSYGAEPSPNDAAVPVQVAPVELANFPLYLDGLGTVVPFNTVSVKTRVDGQLQKVFFVEGQLVKQGDLLAQIDPRPYQAAVDQAAAKIQQDEADLANAQYLLSKDQKLVKQGISTDEAVETQQSQVNQLIAQLAQDKAAKEAADVSLSYTEIRSPIDGRTGIRLIDAGNQVHASDAGGIVIVTQTRPISVISTLREQDLPSVQSALQKGPVTVDAMPSDASRTLASGTLSLIDNEIDQGSGTVRLKSEFDNADGTLWPGQFIILRVLQEIIPSASTVPSSALQRGPSGFFVYVVGTDSRVVLRNVQVGPISGGRAVVLSGLKQSEKVVSDGQYRLREGILVSAQTVPAQAAGGEK